MFLLQVPVTEQHLPSAWKISLSFDAFHLAIYIFKKFEVKVSSHFPFSSAVSYLSFKALS